MLDRALGVERAFLVALDVGVGALQLAVARVHPQCPAEDFLGIVGGAHGRRERTKQRAQTRQPDPHRSMQHDALSVNGNCDPTGTMLPPKPGAHGPGPSKPYPRIPP